MTDGAVGIHSFDQGRSIQRRRERWDGPPGHQINKQSQGFDRVPADDVHGSTVCSSIPFMSFIGAQVFAKLSKLVCAILDLKMWAV